MNSQEIIEKLYNLFHAKNGYTVELKDEVRATDNKKLKKYKRISKELTLQDYSNHYKTGLGLTPSPIVDDSFCYMGCLDIDAYDLHFWALEVNS